MNMSMITVAVNCSISSFPSSLRFRRRAFPHLSLSPPSALCFSGLSENIDSGGGGSGGPCIFPLNRCKTIHLVDSLRKDVHDSGLMKRIDLVIASPLLRTLQTAVGVFGGESYTDITDVLPLMVENAGNSNRAAISSLNCPPIVAVELCREHLGVRPCDKRRSISEYQSLFPAIDFSLIDSNEDTWWKADVRETKEELAARGRKFMNWLGTRKEKEIAIVTHRALLLHTLSAFGNYSHPLEKKELSKPFANCELRSMVIVDCVTDRRR
ncbi:hypothetical protein GYH30_037349 [Glycine max]|nr:hypothetical protein GYH30_037349 [Glycine max]